jgi:hypothetical protein
LAVISGIDTTAGNGVCLEAHNTLSDLFGARRIFRGDTTLVDLPTAQHDGQYSRWINQVGTSIDVFEAIHIDGDYLSIASMRGLGELLVHEALHRGNRPHVGESSPPYSTPPFNRAPECVVNLSP